MQHSRRNRFIKDIIYLFGQLLIVGGLSTGVVAQTGRPEILDYYWSRAGVVWAQNQAALGDRIVACDVQAIVMELSRGGVVKSADTSVSRYFFSHGAVDSTVHLSGRARLTVDVDVSFPSLFDSTYEKTFFPNDSGAGDLAIGFDTDTAGDLRPTGILTIDRNTYTARRLHVTWPHKAGFRRFGRSYHFVQVSDLTLIDTITESAVIERLLADEDYRLETSLSNYQLKPQIDSVSH